MPGASQCSGVIYDSYGRGLAAPEGDLVSVKPDSPEDRKKFLPIGFISISFDLHCISALGGQE